MTESRRSFQTVQLFSRIVIRIVLLVVWKFNSKATALRSSKIVWWETEHHKYMINYRFNFISRSSGLSSSRCWLWFAGATTMLLNRRNGTRTKLTCRAQHNHVHLFIISYIWVLTRIMRRGFSTTGRDLEPKRRRCESHLKHASTLPHGDPIRFR